MPDEPAFVLREDGDNGDWTKGGWDFPQHPDGPWPDDDPRWEPFLRSIHMTLDEFKKLPAYYLAARRKGLIS